MPLTDPAIRKAKAQDKPFRFFDGGGLYLEVSPSGGKLWRWKYRFAGVEKRLSLGVYPDVSLKDARERHTEARRQLSAGIDPERPARRESVPKPVRKALRPSPANGTLSFPPPGIRPTAERMLIRFEKDIFPWLGKRPIAEIKAPDLLTVLRRTENRGALESAHRLMQNCGQVFRYAVATGRTDTGSYWGFSRGAATDTG